MNDFLDINWSGLLIDSSVDEQWNVFLSQINEGVDKYVLLSSAKSRVDNKYREFPVSGKLKEKIKRKAI